MQNEHNLFKDNFLYYRNVCHYFCYFIKYYKDNFLYYRNVCDYFCYFIKCYSIVIEKFVSL